MTTARATLWIALCAAPALAFSQAEDPLKSAACAQALGVLQDARASNQAAAAIEQARGSAAAACLGSASLPRRPSRVVQAPVVIPPPQVEVAPAVALPSPAVIPPPAVMVPRPPVPAFCNAAGCWIQGGTHLQPLGPNLAGPNGLCIQQGALISCP